MRYKILELLGSGGMGEVYRAHDAQLDRVVALKVLPGDDPRLIQRLLREARAQAKVPHAHICEVYDVGQQQGKPFIAMRLIDGETLDRAAAKMSLEEKMQTLLAVTEAVGAAHGQGLIHRDLKPGNVMVERDDGRWHPFVLDFGLALELDAPGLTATGTLHGTPAYMAPEQVGGGPQGLDRRADVYSLGSMLYEVLAGRPPFGGDSPVAVMVEALHNDPPPLRKSVKGVPADLEIIVGKCLEKDPERRYGSARLLAEDLERFLAGQPVMARRPSLGYRLRRRIQRNKAVAAVAALSVALLLIVGVGGGIKYTLDLERERRQAVAARLEAEAAEAEAEEVSQFLVDLFEVLDPGKTKGETITAREILENGAREAEELTDQPLVQARLLAVIGNVFTKLGLYDRGAECLERALELRRTHLGDRHPEVAETLHTFGFLRREERNFEAAEALYAQALAIREDHLDASDEVVALSRLGLGGAIHYGGRSAEAEPLVRQAAEVLSRLHDEDDPKVLEALEIHATVLRATGDLEASKALFYRVLGTQRRTLEEGDPTLSRTLNNLAFVHTAQGDYAAAEGRFREALALLEATYGEDHPNTFVVMQNLSGALSRQEKWPEVEATLLEVARRQRRSLSADDWRLGNTLAFGLGRSCLQQGLYARAEPYLQEGLAVLAASLGEGHDWVAFTRANLGASLLGSGRGEEAGRLFDASLAVLEASELSRGSRPHIERAVEYLEALGAAETADRYRALLF